MGSVASLGKRGTPPPPSFHLQTVHLAGYGAESRATVGEVVNITQTYSGGQAGTCGWVLLTDRDTDSAALDGHGVCDMALV